MAVTDILITPAKIYRAPVGEALPDETSVAYDGAWGGNWTDLGYTLQPITMAHSRALFELFVEQINGAVKRRVNDEKAIFETVLAEATPTNLSYAVGGTVTTTPAGASQKAFQDLDVGGEWIIGEAAFGLEGLYENATGVQFPLRIFIYKATCVMNGQLQFAKAAGAGIPIQISAINDTAKDRGKQLFKFQRVTAAATS
ncbi:MAG TPA: hypothetical protein PKA43_00200 [Candidatus Competibacter phosphatis]|nr:hypothetical protein [Candidatus Competibacter phosphatis]